MQSVEGSLGSWLVAQRMHAVKCPSLVLVAASLVHPCCSPRLVTLPLQATPYIVAALGRGGGTRQPQSWCHGSASELLRSAAARPNRGPMLQVLTQTERFLQVSSHCLDCSYSSEAL